MTRSLLYIALVTTCTGSCATAPTAPSWLCGSYDSPPQTRTMEFKDGHRESWVETRCLDLEDDWTCRLSYGSGLCPTGRWTLETAEGGSRRVMVWPVDPNPLGLPPTPADEFMLFTVTQHEGQVALVRGGEVWTR